MTTLLSRHLSVIIFILMGAELTLAQPPNWNSISEKVVRHALNVQPGETVIITGVPTQIDFLSSLQVATEKAGGLPTIQLYLPEATKRSLMETPIEYLGQPPLYRLQQMRNADCVIDIQSVEEPDLYADVPEDRLSAYRRSTDLLDRAKKRAHYRHVTLGQTGGIPTQAYAKSQGAGYKEMIAMFWSSLDVDYDMLLKSGQDVAARLKPHSQVHLITTSGTDLKFRIGNTPSRLNSGRTADNVLPSGVAQVWLPAGETYACTDPTSANGILVIPYLTFRGIPTTNIRMTFKDGRMTEFKADKNSKMLQEYFNNAKGDIDVLSVVDIGLNPNSHPLKGSPYASFEMAGIVTLGIGNSTWAGCDLKSDTGLSMHIAQGTLSIDGLPLIENGNLK